MIFLSKNTKSNRSSNRLLRTASAGILSLVIVVNVFGSYAPLAFAQIPPALQTVLDGYTARAAEARRLADQAAQNAGTLSSTSTLAIQRQIAEVAGSLASTTAAAAQRQTELNAAGLNSTSLTSTERGQVLAQVGNSVGIAGAAVLTGGTVYQQVTSREAAARQAQTTTQNQQTNQPAQRTTAPASGTTPAPSTGSRAGAPGKNDSPAEHPLSICVSAPIAKFSMCIAGIFYLFFVDLTAPIAYLAGGVFDSFANISLTSGTYASTMISKAWVIARDVANMAFVFVLIYIAFLLILNIEGVGVGKQIAKVIAVALLINFSFFFSRVIIDISNILAHQFYDNIAGAPSPAKNSWSIGLTKQVLGAANAVGGLATDTTGNDQIISISEKVMTGINPQLLLGNDQFKKYLDDKKTGVLGNIALLMTLFFIFGVINIILAAVFITASVQFLIRIIALWFAVILSPIAFISLITPHAKGMGSKWLKLIISNAFYAPAFMFVIYIAISMLDNNLLSNDISGMLASSLQNSEGGAGIKGFLNNIIGVILRLSIVVGLFIGALKVGSFIGAESADKAESWGKKIGVGGSARLMGWAGRNTAGAGGFMLSQASRNLAAGQKGYLYDANGKVTGKKAGMGGFMARTVGVGIGRVGEIAGGKLATSSFDGRALPGVSGAGTAQKGGYKKATEDKVKRLEHNEHERHNTPEQKEASKKRGEAQMKIALGYDAAKNELADSEREAARVTELHTKALQDANEAASLGSADQIAATKVIVDSLQKLKEAEEAKVTKKSARIEEMDKQINKNAGSYEDNRRKYAEAENLSSRGLHNLWGISTRASDRAAYNIVHGKSKEKKFAEEAKKLLADDHAEEEHAPKPAPKPVSTGGGAATPPPAAGGGGHH